MKSLKEISWDVDEATYRADPALSYSTIARYEREGFNNLDKLFDKLDTPSLTFGRAVDSTITGGQAEFDKEKMSSFLDSNGIPYILEASGSEHSYHIWILLEPVKARIAKAFGKDILKAVDID